MGLGFRAWGLGFGVLRELLCKGSLGIYTRATLTATRGFDKGSNPKAPGTQI